MVEIKTHIALFAGLGGFIQATRKLGIRTLVANDNDPSCIKTLEHNFPNMSVINSDIRDLSINHVVNDNEIDLLTAGFPCQSFSIAGDNLGFEDPRGKLFFEISRIIKECQSPPKAVLLENVPNLKLYNSGERLAVVIRELRSLGYWVNQNNAMILNANEYGASPQNRERLFILALHSKYFKSNRMSESLLEQSTPTNLWSIIRRKESKDKSDYLDENNKYIVPS